MAGGRIFHLRHGRLIQQLEAIVATGRQRLHVLEAETAILDAGEKRKQLAAAQLLEHALVDALDIDLQVIGHAELGEQAAQRDALHGDFLVFGRVVPSPSDIQAAPMVIIEIDVKTRLAVLIPDRGI